MPADPRSQLPRRDFLHAGALAATAIGLSETSHAQVPQARAAALPDLPRRKLGKTGAELTILNLGTWQNPGLANLLRLAFAGGVRTYDTAKSYGSEPGIARWLASDASIRKQIFLVSKDGVGHPSELVKKIDERLEALGTDYLDLYFAHALGSNQVDWGKDPEFRAAADAIRKSGKARFVGFSTHDTTRAQQIRNAAEGGFVDAIMLQFSPWIARDGELNRALDAAHAAGIGLISMKQVAGNSGWAQDDGDTLAETERRVPELAERKLSVFQGLLQAIWTDERITTSCVSMRNTDQIRQNVAAARSFAENGPLKLATIGHLRDACIARGPTLCADCTGACSRAAGTGAALGDLTRLLTYHEHHGYKAEARRLYGELAASERDWRGADLEAARHACPNRLDFAGLLPRVDELLA